MKLNKNNIKIGDKVIIARLYYPFVKKNIGHIDTIKKINEGTVILKKIKQNIPIVCLEFYDDNFKLDEKAYYNPDWIEIK